MCKGKPGPCCMPLGIRHLSFYYHISCKWWHPTEMVQGNPIVFWCTSKISLHNYSAGQGDFIFSLQNLPAGNFNAGTFRKLICFLRLAMLGSQMGAYFVMCSPSDWNGWWLGSRKKKNLLKSPRNRCTLPHMPKHTAPELWWKLQPEGRHQLQHHTMPCTESDCRQNAGCRAQHNALLILNGPVEHWALTVGALFWAWYCSDSYWAAQKAAGQQAAWPLITWWASALCWPCVLEPLAASSNWSLPV